MPEFTAKQYTLSTQKTLKKTSSQEPFSLQREITSDTFGTPKHQQAPTCNVLTPSGAIWGVPFGGVP